MAVQSHNQGFSISDDFDCVLGAFVASVFARFGDVMNGSRDRGVAA